MAAGGGGSGGEKAQESGEGFRKGPVNETAALGAGALAQTREVGWGLGCCLLACQTNLGYTSKCLCASPQGQRPARPLALDSRTETLR